MSTIPNPSTEPHDSLESAMEAIRAHRKAHGFAMVQKRSKFIAGTSEKRIVYLEYDRHGRHIFTSLGIRQASTKALNCSYSIVLRRKVSD